jgi:hypothetical protein
MIVHRKNPDPCHTIKNANGDQPTALQFSFSALLVTGSFASKHFIRIPRFYYRKFSKPGSQKPFPALNRKEP